MRRGRVDTEAHPALAQRYRIASIPSLIAFSRGEEIARQSGALGAGALRGWITSLPGLQLQV